MPCRAALCGLGGLFYAARQGSTDSTTGVGWEFQALTAVVLGGVSLAGGKGTVWRAMLGGIIVFALTNGLVRMGIPGYITSAIIGLILLAAVGIDVKWTKNRGKAIQKIYVNPAKVPLVTAPALKRGSGTVFAQNDRLINAEAIGLNQVEGPEDVILDRQDRLYGSTRDGNIIRFSGPNFEHREVFAHIGGRPLGMQFDKEENLIVAVAGMGVYGIKPERRGVQGHRRDQPHLVQAERRLAGCAWPTTSTSRPDGKIWFSDCTTRYEMTTNSLDIMEGRPNGRVVVYDPTTKKTWTEINHFYFPNGICVSHDGKSILIASTSLCQVFRYWVEGPRKGELEVLLDQAPGQLRQHQPRLGRQLLAGAGRHPHAGLRPRHEESGLPPAYGEAGPDRRMAGTRHEPWLHPEIQPEAARCSNPIGIRPASRIRP